MTYVLHAPLETGPRPRERLRARMPFMGILCAMMISLSHSVGAMAQSQNGAEALPDADLMATITEFSRDKVVFDSDIMRGNDNARVPLSGTTTAPDGTVMEARAVSTDDGGATTTTWRSIGTAAGGAWSGVLDTPRSKSWYRAEVRTKGSAVPVAQTTNRFGVGLVFYNHRASNGSRAYNSTGSAPVPDLTGIGSDFQVWRLNDTGISTTALDTRPVEGPLFVANGNPVTTALAAMAEVFLKNAPGLKVTVLADARAGRSLDQTLDDDGTLSETRLFSKVQELFTAAHADGQEVGAYVNDDIWADGSVEHIEQQFFGGPGGDSGVPLAPGAEHAMHTIMPGLLTGRTQILLGSIGMFYETKTNPNSGDDRRRIMNEFVAAYPTRAKRLLEYEFANRFDNEADPLSIANGNHMTKFQEYGSPLFLAGRAMGLLQAAGVLTFEQPIFDMVGVEPGGAYVEIWSSAGPITTIERQEALLEGRAPINYPINPSNDPAFEDLTVGDREILVGQFADFTMPTRIEIVDDLGDPAAAGRVRIYPDSGTFNSTTLLYQGDGYHGVNFGGLGGGNSLRYARDAFTQRHLPIIDMGVQGRIVEYGTFVAPNPDRNWIVNALGAELQGGAYSMTWNGPADPVEVGIADADGMTFHFRVNPRDTAVRIAQETTGSQFFSFLIFGTDRVVLRARNSGIEELFDYDVTTNFLTDADGFVELFVNLDALNERIEVYHLNPADGTWVAHDPAGVWFDNTVMTDTSPPTSLRPGQWTALNLGGASNTNFIDFLKYWRGSRPGLTAPPTETPWREIKADPAGALDATAFAGPDSNGSFDVLEDGVARTP